MKVLVAFKLTSILTLSEGRKSSKLMFPITSLLLATSALIGGVSAEPCITVGGPRPGAPCVFPFRWGNVEYNQCQKSGEKFWCSTSNDPYGHIGNEWGYCPTNNPTECFQDTTYTDWLSSNGRDNTGTRNSKNNIDESVQWSGMQTKHWGNDQCKNLGNFDSKFLELEECKKKCLETATCTAINYAKVKKFCMLRGCTQPVQAPQGQHPQISGYYIMDKKRGECTTISGSPCVFPFTYKSTTYNSCTRDNVPDEQPWCSTKVDSQGNHIPAIGNWGRCSGDCGQDWLSSNGRDNTGTRNSKNNIDGIQNSVDFKGKNNLGKDWLSSNGRDNTGTRNSKNNIDGIQNSVDFKGKNNLGKDGSDDYK